MNFISIISKPIIGAIIGYSTNYIAIKMMFRPLNEVRIGKIKIPFTPGIIPKNKSRIASAISRTVSNDLLSEEDIKKALLSVDTKESLRKELTPFIREFLVENNKSLNLTLLEFISEEKINEISEKIEIFLSEKIYNSVRNSNIGEVIAYQITKAAEEKLSGSILGFFGGNSILASISEISNQRITEYIERNGTNLVRPLVHSEIKNTLEENVSDIYSNLNLNEESIENIIIAIYEKIVLNNASSFIKSLNIERIVENKINNMDTLELEKMILSIMKKELNALVNLGALIGFVLGLLNLII